MRADGGPPALLDAEVGQRLSGREILDTLFRQKWKIMLLWSAVVIAAIAYVFLTPRMYESDMTILVKDKRVDVALGPEGGEKSDLGASDTQVATEIQLLSSRELFRMVALKSGLAKSASPADLDRAVGKLKRGIRIGPVLKSSLIQVKYSDSDPKRCAQVLELLAEFYMDMHLQLHSSPGSYEFFSKQAAEYEKKLREAHANLLAFQSRTKIVLLPEQKDLALRKLLEVESSLREAQALKGETAFRASKLRDQMSSMGRRITTQMRKIPNQYSVERLNTLIAELQNKRTELLTKFRPDDRMIKQIDQQIADTRKAMDSASAMSSTEEATDVNPVRQIVEGELARAEVTANGLNSRIVALSKQIGDLRGELSRLENASPDDQLLLREVNVAEQNLLLYSKKREEARIAQELDQQKIANVVVVDPPRVPGFPKSRLGSGLPAAFLLASILVVAVCFALGHRRNVVHTPWELETALGLPVLATIPLNGNPILGSPPLRARLLELEGQIQQ